MAPSALASITEDGEETENAVPTSAMTGNADIPKKGEKKLPAGVTIQASPKTLIFNQ
ncbi:MAG: hypothetical protein Fur0046_03800 [Cyanobacteria bacterium J069]